MLDARRRELIEVYRRGLLEDTLPFWMKHAVDREAGGYLFFLDEDGTVLGTDKPMWIHGRFVWLLSALYNTVEARPEWLDLARHGIEFIRQHGFDTDGRMFFLLDRQGRPLRKRRYLFTEHFTVCGLAAYARAARDAQAAEEAMALLRLLVEYETSGKLQPKWNTELRPTKGLDGNVMLISTGQILRDALDEPFCAECIDQGIENIANYLMNEDFQAVMDCVNGDGTFLDTFEGRQITPGTGLEVARFILDEAKFRNDASLLEMGLKMVDWSWNWGWDAEYGGIINHRDVRGFPCTEYSHDMKFWWTQCEAIVATLRAHDLTGDARYEEMHARAHDWAHAHYPDPENGEWFGYLHRDGRISSRLKGNVWKGPFHIPRMQRYCWKLLEPR